MDSGAWGGNAGSAVDSEKAMGGRHCELSMSVVS